jgi:hypothetical protein
MAAFGSVLFSSTIRKNAPAGMTERKAKAKTSVEMTGLTESVRNPG